MAEACGVVLCYMFLLILLLHKNRWVVGTLGFSNVWKYSVALDGKMDISFTSRKGS